MMGNDHTLPVAQLSEEERGMYERERNYLPSLHVASFLGDEAKIRGDRRLQTRDVNKRSRMGRTALQYACIRGHENIVKLMLQRNATVNNRDVDGQTPLSECINRGFYGCQKLLVESAAVVNLHDNEQRTPLHLACRRGDLQTVNLLLDNGAKMDVQDANGLTPLALARAGGYNDVCSRLERNAAGEDVPDAAELPPAAIAGIGTDGDYLRTIAEQSQRRQHEAAKRLDQKRRELDHKKHEIQKEIRQLQQRAEIEERHVQDAKAATEMKRGELTREVELMGRNLGLEEELEAKTRQHELHLESELRAQALRFSDEMQRQREVEEENRLQWQGKVKEDLMQEVTEMEKHRAAMEERLSQDLDNLETRKKELIREQKLWREEVEEERKRDRANWEQEKQQQIKQMEKRSRRLDEKHQELEGKYQQKVEQLQEQLRVKVEELHDRENVIRTELEMKFSEQQKGLDEDKDCLRRRSEQLEQQFSQKLSEKEAEMRQLIDDEWARVRALEDKLEKRRFEDDERLKQRQVELDKIRETMQQKLDSERDALVTKMRNEHEAWVAREKQLVTALEKSHYEQTATKERLAQVQLQLENESRQRGQTEERAHQEITLLKSKYDSLVEERDKERLKLQDTLTEKDEKYASRERAWLAEQQRKADDMKKREAEILRRRQELESERHKLEHSYYDNWMKRRLAAEEQHLELGTPVPATYMPERGPFLDLPKPVEQIARYSVVHHQPMSKQEEIDTNEIDKSLGEDLRKSLETMLVDHMAAVGQWKAEVTSQLEKTQHDSQRRDELQRLERSWGDFEHRVTSMIGDMRRDQEQQNQVGAQNALAEAAMQSEAVKANMLALQEKVIQLDHQLSSEQSRVAGLVGQLSNQAKHVDELHVTRDLQRIEESLERVLEQSQLVHGEIERQNQMIEQQREENLQLQQDMLSSAILEQSPEEQTIDPKHEAITERLPRTSTPTKQISDEVDERGSHLLIERHSDRVLAGGNSSGKSEKTSRHTLKKCQDNSQLLKTNSSGEGRQLKLLTAQGRKQMADSAHRISGSSKRSVDDSLEGVFVDSQEGKLGNKSACRQAVKQAPVDIRQTVNIQQRDEEDELLRNDSDSDVELKDLQASSIASPEPFEQGHGTSDWHSITAAASATKHQRPLSTSPPRSTLIGKLYLGRSAKQTRPFSVNSYYRVDSEPRSATAPPYQTQSSWQPRQSLQDHKYSRQKSGQSVEDSLLIQRYEIQKLKSKLSEKTEEKNASDRILMSTRDQLGAARGRLLREQMAHSFSIRDRDHLHSTVQELSHTTDKSATEIANLQQLLDSSQPV